MNNLTYARNGEYVDPFTSDLWNHYWWVNSTSNLEVVTIPLTFTTPTSYQTYLIQADPFIYQISSIPPPVVDFSLSRYVLYNIQYLF
jgi:hypothetical protein